MIRAASRSGNRFRLAQRQFFQCASNPWPRPTVLNIFTGQRTAARPKWVESAQSAEGNLILKTPFDFATAIVVKRDGEIFKTIRANTRRQLVLPISRAGVYRAEISLASGRFRKLPWIITNPVYIAPRAVEINQRKPQPALSLAEGENYFQVEKNSRSSARPCMGCARGETARHGLDLHPANRSIGPDRLLGGPGAPGRTGGSAYQGFFFETRGSGRMRFWLQFRTGSGRSESAYQHSFLVEDAWRKIVIPFSGFHRLIRPAGRTRHGRHPRFLFPDRQRQCVPRRPGEIFFRQIGLY